MERFAYAIYTDACTYFLDENGVCLRVLAARGTPPASAERSVGAQYVACFDPAIPGGLTGELTVGSSALLVGTSGETGRLVLLRTGAIIHVDQSASDTGRLEPITVDLATDEFEILQDMPLKRAATRKRARSSGSGAGSRPRKKQDSVTVDDYPNPLRGAPRPSTASPISAASPRPRRKRSPR